MVDKGDISDLSQMYPFYKGQLDNRTNSGFYTRSTVDIRPVGPDFLHSSSFGIDEKINGVPSSLAI